VFAVKVSGPPGPARVADFFRSITDPLLDYSGVRLERCRFGVEKPTCANCPVHCYQRASREQVKAVMRHAAPRMVWNHPIMSLGHWLDGFRKAPEM
jgi:hypothetical protein